MRIKNLTPTMQEVSVREIRGDGRDYIIYLEPNSTTEIENMIILSKEKLGKSIEIEGSQVSIEIPVVEIVAPEVAPESTIPESNEEIIENEPVIMEDKFICDICGAEFGSARGLASHKNRTHSD